MMTTKPAAKRFILRYLSTHLSKDVDYLPEDVNVDDPRAFRPWEDAIRELVEEFERRGEEP
jgi:hypothetical protein